MKKNKKWYSIIVVIIIIWFLLVLTSWVFRLVMNEFFDNRTLGNYIKTYAWAESSQELALLWIKEVWYWYEKELKNSDLIDKNSFRNKLLLNFWKKDDWFSLNYNWKINSWEIHIIPLFYINEAEKIENLKNLEKFTVLTSWKNTDIAWNIVWKRDWISWVWSFSWLNEWYFKSLSLWKLDFSTKRINDFLKDSEENYLFLFNWWNSEIDYNLTSQELFTKPEIEIISSAEISNFRTNLKTKVNLEELTSRSKYSIFSP